MKSVVNLFLLFLFLQAKAATHLSFQEQITADAKYLGDLLLITPDFHHWAKLPLDNHPKNEKYINKKQLVLWMQNKIGPFPYQWQGKHTAIIHYAKRASAKELLNKAQTSLISYLKNQNGGTIVLQNITKLKDSEIPLNHFTVLLPQKSPPAKRICVHLNYKKYSIPIWFHVALYQKVWVAKRPMKNRILVRQSDFIFKKRNIAGLKTRPLKKLPQYIWLNHSMTQNQILTQNNLAQQPKVMQGTKVKVTVQAEKISISTEAIAQNDGYTGQLIRMKNQRTNQYFFAKVIGKNQAEVEA